jgi:hypothetical protein
MSEWFDTAQKSVVHFFAGLYNWFFLLNREEWFLLLAMTMAMGFLCMRGFGSRGKY